MTGLLELGPTGPGSSKPPTVDLLMSYSKHVDLAADLAKSLISSLMFHGVSTQMSVRASGQLVAPGGPTCLKIA